MPPSTRSTCPVTYDESLVTKNSTALATSCGQPYRVNAPGLHLALVPRRTAGFEPGRDDFAGSDDVRVHAVRTKLRRQAPRVLVHRRLGNAVRHLSGMSRQARYAADGDDPALVPLHHLRHHLSADENACAQVAIENRLDIGQGNVDRVVDDGLAGVLRSDALRTDIAAGIVDENVDTAEAIPDLTDVARHRIDIGQIAMHREHIRPVRRRNFHRHGIERLRLPELSRRCRRCSMDSDLRAEALRDAQRQRGRFHGKSPLPRQPCSPDDSLISPPRLVNRSIASSGGRP